MVAKESRSFIHDIFSHYRLQVAITGILVILWIIFTVINPKAFGNPYLYRSMLTIIPFTLIPAITLTLIIISGEIDLSFSSIMAVGALVMALTWKALGPNFLVLGIILGLLAGLAAGLLNGVLVTKIGIPSLIATIGTMFFWRGVVLVATGGFSIPLAEFREQPVYQLFVGRLGGIIPAQFIWSIILVILFWVILNRHVFGACIYYIGDNRLAAKMLGINTDRTLIILFMIHGMVAAFAGMLPTMEMATFWPQLGEIYMLKSIAAVVVGGTPITGGIGTIYGTVIGAIMLEFIETGVVAAGATGFWIRLIHGLVIIVALSVQGILRKEEILRALESRLSLR